MSRVKVIGKFSDAQQAVIAEMNLKNIFKTDKSVTVGPTEANVYLPIYCPENVQATIISSLDGLGATNITVDSAKMK